MGKNCLADKETYVQNYRMQEVLARQAGRTRADMAVRRSLFPSQDGCDASDLSEATLPLDPFPEEKAAELKMLQAAKAQELESKANMDRKPLEPPCPVEPFEQQTPKDVKEDEVAEQKTSEPGVQDGKPKENQKDEVKGGQEKKIAEPEAVDGKPKEKQEEEVKDVQTEVVDGKLQQNEQTQAPGSPPKNNEVIVQDAATKGQGQDGKQEDTKAAGAGTAKAKEGEHHPALNVSVLSGLRALSDSD